ncbi:hypothetical protein PRIPAC_85938 [Pristionchus pacificus]|uniref:Uncharacterized protein n=1 Tax=Pristionchus pacificus TaxID=54126 RepID=A0A2A6BTI6_PRIPA|nr:hypothetical protein PRIPAC_85938 [Pristionchus pacificus]|eukprot:PDM69198.1 hypothetical protein PRIPAC_47500 [Pristionchus pacificus]
MWLLILLSTLPAATIGCVPVKNPDKGISAGCQKYESGVAVCNEIFIDGGAPPPGPCVANTALTSMSILCPAGKIPALFGPNAGLIAGFSKATCDATTKHNTEKKDENEEALNTNNSTADHS